MKLSYINIYQSSLIINIIVLCILPKFTTLAIAILFIVSIVGIFKKELIFNTNIILFSFILFYLLYLIYTFSTFNHYLSNLYIVNKLPFVIFPIIFSFKLKNGFTFNATFIGLIIGVIILTITSLLGSFILYLENKMLIESFTTVNFSKIHHPSYFSTFNLLSIFLAIYAYKQKWKYFNFWNTCIFILIASFSIILCKSLASYVFVFLFILIVLIYKTIYFLKNKRTFWIFIFLNVVFILLLSFLIKSNLKMNDDIGNTLNSLKYFYSDPIRYSKEHPGYKTGNQTRLIMWTASILEIIEHPFGVGTGNVDYFLSKRLKILGQSEMAKMDDKKQIQFNPHNQFFQTTLEIGIIGLIILLFIIIQVFIVSFKTKNWILLFLVLNLLFNCLFESMLQRQSGIVFYTFWICLLSTYSLSIKNDENEDSFSHTILST